MDVAIVGGGFTGLWTARELLRRDPRLTIAIFEKSVCGFGASGRNGGWASALFPLSDDEVQTRHGREALIHQRSLLERAVPELGQAALADQIDAHFFQGGSLTFARNAVQESRLRENVRRSHEERSDSALRWLNEGELYEYGYVYGARGATYNPHCARLHPARLVRALSDVVEGLGASIFEGTDVTRIEPGSNNRLARVVSTGGCASATYVVRATEGFTPTLPGQRRSTAPIYSLMIATEPQTPSFWDEVGFRRYETFADARHNIIYGQRTNDDRIAFGGRGAPYHFGSSVEPRYDQNARTFRALEDTLRTLFPTFTGVISHRWGGPLAMPRDHEPSVLVDHATGMASAGNYTGDGVVLSRVCAQALADLITQPGVRSEFTSLPFVGHTSPKWEFEPWRWIGANSARSLANRADRVEERFNRTSRASAFLDRLLG